MALQIEEKHLDGVLILDLTGRVKLGEETVELRNKIKQILENATWLKDRWGWQCRIVLDMARVDYVDSAGLGTMVGAHASAFHHGVNLKLASPSKALRNQLVLTKLVTVFEVYDSVGDAVNSYPKPSGA